MELFDGAHWTCQSSHELWLLGQFAWRSCWKPSENRGGWDQKPWERYLIRSESGSQQYSLSCLSVLWVVSSFFSYSPECTETSSVLASWRTHLLGASQCYRVLRMSSVQFLRCQRGSALHLGCGFPHGGTGHVGDLRKHCFQGASVCSSVCREWSRDFASFPCRYFSEPPNGLLSLLEFVLVVFLQVFTNRCYPSFLPWGNWANNDKV